MPKHKTKQLGENIRRLRKKKGLTQEQLGESAQIHYSYVGQVERGEKMPSLKTLQKLAAALNTKLQYILEGPVTYNINNELPPEITAFLELVKGRSPEEIKLFLNILREVIKYLDSH